MAELSPAAQAAIDAVWKNVPVGMRDPYVVRLEQVAAAYQQLALRIMGADGIRNDVFAIAAELRLKAAELEGES